MAIEPGFQVRLGIYRIDAETINLRGEIWRLLGPRLDTIIASHIANVIECAPLYRTKIEEGRKSHTDTIKFYTKKLLHNPFDEEWVKDAYDRANFEIKTGFDMRSRGAISISLLNDLNSCIFEHYRFLPRKGLRLLNAATRIFMLDAANAVACHNSVEVQQAKKRTDELGSAIENFSRAIEDVRGVVENVVKSISSTSDQLAELAKTASGQTNTATQAAEDTASKISAIATAAEQLGASIEQMHSQAMESVQTAQKAVAYSARTDTNIRSLSEAVEKIGSVVSLISQIAAQTNLLALNATIEAARAGEAGRGFAVVASEVKSLAVQTAKATNDVGQQIDVIQDAMRRSMGEIASTSQSITEISGVAGSVAETVMQQAGATNEIAKNANGAALNATTVADALKTMQDTIRRTQDATNLVLTFSKDLSRRSAEIGGAMDTLFKAAAQSSTVKEFANLAGLSRH